MTKPNNSREHWHGGRKEYARPHKQERLLADSHVAAIKGNPNTPAQPKLQIEKSPNTSDHDVVRTSNEERYKAAQRGFFAHRTWAEVASTAQALKP